MDKKKKTNVVMRDGFLSGLRTESPRSLKKRSVRETPLPLIAPRKLPHRKTTTTTSHPSDERKKTTFKSLSAKTNISFRSLFLLARGPRACTASEGPHVTREDKREEQQQQHQQRQITRRKRKKKEKTQTKQTKQTHVSTYSLASRLGCTDRQQNERDDQNFSFMTIYFILQKHS